MNKNYLNFNPTHAVFYKGEKILVQAIGDGEFATKEDWEKNGVMIGSFAIDEDNEEMPTSEVWVKHPDDFVGYTDADSEIKLIKICPNCFGTAVTKNGKTPAGYQRWKCADCDRSLSDNKIGRPCLYDRPMTTAERKRRQRKKKK